ncbi:MAG: TfoX/Sxy family protein [Candidatus Limnocylindria bacterium]
MAYDEALAERIRAVLADRDNVTEQKMFGGIAFMISDRMAVGVVHDDLMVRVGPDAHDDAVARPHARPMDFTGRPMRGFVYVAPAGAADDRDLAQWVEAGAAFAASQPPKRRR